MKKNIYNPIYFYTFLLTLTCLSVAAQDSTQNVMFRAMKDELNRSMKQLVYKDYQKPFYISYTIEDVKTLYVSSSLGSLTSSSEKRYRSWSNRILCGDYQLNDENFIDATRRKPTSDGNLQLPLDDDYFGIRRALWLMTNNTYKSAAENYKSKLASLKDKNLGKDDLQIPDFSMEARVQKNLEPIKTEWNKEKLENELKAVSAVFLNYPDIFYSEVSAYQIHADLYFYSSEETQIKTPLDFIFVTLSAYYQSSDGDNENDQIRYNVQSTLSLPPLDSMKNDASILAKNLIKKGNAHLLNENYSGPVLFLGQAASQIFLQGLFTGTDNLYAYREPLYNSSQMSMYYGQNINSLEAKLDKQVVSKTLTVKDIPSIKTYNNNELLGSYVSDAEGVIPSDTLTLIESGILKTFYNGRTPTRKISNSNGHRRYTLQNGAISSDIAPGVIQISTKEGKSIDKLKQDLLTAAKEEGLDFAIIIKPIKTSNSEVPIEVYKIMVADGKEELIRGTSMSNITINSLKKIGSVSSNSILFNTVLSGVLRDSDGAGAMPEGQETIPSGIPVSIISPDGIILKEVEFDHTTKPLSSDRPIVTNPLLK